MTLITRTFTNPLDLFLAVIVILIYLFKLKNIKKIKSKYRLVLIFESIICTFIQFTRYNSGDLFYYSNTLKFTLQHIYYSAAHSLTSGYLFGSIILIFLLIELRLIMLKYLLVLDNKINIRNKILNKFSQRLYIYLFIFSPSFNIFLFFQGKDIIAAIMLTGISILILEKLINIEKEKRLFKYSDFYIILFSSSLFIVRFYYFAVYIFGLITTFLFKLIVFLKIKYSKLTYKGLLLSVIGIIFVVSLILALDGISRIDFFYDYISGSSELQQRFTGLEKASVQLEPWNWPWKVFNVIRPLPWNFDKFNLFQKIIIVDHYISLSVMVYLLMRLNSNKIFTSLMTFFMITLCTIWTFNINDMYRRLPVYLMLPIPIVLKNKYDEFTSKRTKFLN